MVRVTYCQQANIRKEAKHSIWETTKFPFKERQTALSVKIHILFIILSLPW